MTLFQDIASCPHMVKNVCERIIENDNGHLIVIAGNCQGVEDMFCKNKKARYRVGIPLSDLPLYISFPYKSYRFAELMRGSSEI